MINTNNKIEKVRAILKEYDDGLSSEMGCEADLRHLFMDPFLKTIEEGCEYMTFGSCCCSGHEPDIAFKVQFTMRPHGFTAKRCEK